MTNRKSLSRWQALRISADRASHRLLYPLGLAIDNCCYGFPCRAAVTDLKSGAKLRQKKAKSKKWTLEICPLARKKPLSFSGLMKRNIFFDGCLSGHQSGHRVDRN